MIAAIRLRGNVKTPEKTEDTLKMLNLKNVHNCTIIPETPDYQGMLQKVKGYITWGEINKETLTKLIEKKSNTEKDTEKLAEEIMEKEEKPEEIEETFRLHPPKGGFKGTKKNPYGKKGELGYRGKEINSLIKRMI